MKKLINRIIKIKISKKFKELRILIIPIYVRKFHGLWETGIIGITFSFDEGFYFSFEFVIIFDFIIDIDRKRRCKI